MRIARPGPFITNGLVVDNIGLLDANICLLQLSTLGSAPRARACARVCRVNACCERGKAVDSPMCVRTYEWATVPVTASTKRWLARTVAVASRPSTKRCQRLFSAEAAARSRAFSATVDVTLAASCGTSRTFAYVSVDVPPARTIESPKTRFRRIAADRKAVRADAHQEAAPVVAGPCRHAGCRRDARLRKADP